MYIRIYVCVYQLLRFAGLPGFHLVCVNSLFLALLSSYFQRRAAVQSESHDDNHDFSAVKTFGTSLSACDNASTIRSLVIAAKSELYSKRTEEVEVAFTAVADKA